MRALVLSLGVVGLLTIPAVGQEVPHREKEPICAPALRGVVRLGDGRGVRNARVEVLVGTDRQVFLRTRTNRDGRFQVPGGRPKAGSEWTVRVSGPGQTGALVKVTIAPVCRDLVIRLTPGGTP